MIRGVVLVPQALSGLRIYITPTFGTLPAAKLDAELLECFYARLQRCRQLCMGRPNGWHACWPAEQQHGPQDSLHHQRGAGAGSAVAAPGG